MNENVLSIWDHSAKHKKDARGLEKLRGEIDASKQNKTVNHTTTETAYWQNARLEVTRSMFSSRKLVKEV